MELAGLPLLARRRGRRIAREISAGSCGYIYLVYLESLPQLTVLVLNQGLILGDLRVDPDEHIVEPNSLIGSPLEDPRKFLRSALVESKL